MPRRMRTAAESGIYHVIFRGVNRQCIFEDDDDEKTFLKILGQCSQECDFSVLAYCLMGNHVHLLLKFEDPSVSSAMKKLAVKYVSRFNSKYDRIGHLFQDRFKSEPVDDDAYLLTVFRYILRNPVKAGIVEDPFDYPSSSAADYIQGNGITDTTMILSMLSGRELIDFVSQDNEDTCLDVDTSSFRRLTDEDAREVILDVCGCSSVADFQALSKPEQHAAVTAMTSSGISLRQASRLTGLSIGVIRGHLRKN